MIPKIIHYCWFGGKPKPELAQKCIESWKKYLPEYELREWNEETFPIKESVRYVREAYKMRKYAFVTDYVRLWALYNYGGIYMDTDVEVLKPLDRFLHHNAFSGFEDNQFVPTGIMGAEKGSVWVKELLDPYAERRFILKGGYIDTQTNTYIITKYMEGKGMPLDDRFHDVEGYVAMYPHDWFCPKSWQTGEITLTYNTHTIHHFAGSWRQPYLPLRGRIKKALKPYLEPLGIVSAYKSVRKLFVKD